MTVIKCLTDLVKKKKALIMTHALSIIQLAIHIYLILSKFYVFYSLIVYVY